MPIQIKDETVYILLKRLHEGDLKGQGQHELKLSENDFAGREVTQAELLGTLDYLNQRGYINAKFSGNAYGNQEDVPDSVDTKEFDLRIANTYGSPDGPLPHVIAFETAELTEKGVQMLKEMEANPPQALQSGPETQIATKDMPFLEKVMLKGELEDIFDARDVTEVVFRTMRDMMTTEASDRVAGELHEEAEPTKDKALQNEIADLWKDTNPIVSFLSRVRPLWKLSQKSSYAGLTKRLVYPSQQIVKPLSKQSSQRLKTNCLKSGLRKLLTFYPIKSAQCGSKLNLTEVIDTN